MLGLKRNVMEYGDWRTQHTILTRQWSDKTLQSSNINQDDPATASVAIPGSSLPSFTDY